MTQIIGAARFINGRVRGLFLTKPRFNDGPISSRQYQIDRAPSAGDGGEEGGPDPGLCQASVNRGDTQLRFRGLDKAWRRSKVRRLSLIGLQGSGANRTQGDDFLEIPSKRVLSAQPEPAAIM